METALIVTIIQSAVTFFLLWSNRKSNSEDYYLSLLIIVFALHTGFKYVLWLLTDDYDVFNKVHSSFSLLYGPFLLFYYRKAIHQPIALRQTFIHYVPFLIVSVFNIVVIKLVVDHQNGPLIDLYSQVSQFGIFVASSYSAYIVSQTIRKKSANSVHSDPAYAYKLKIIWTISFTLAFPILVLLIDSSIGFTNPPNYRYLWYGVVLIMLALVLHYRFKLFQQNLELLGEKVSETNPIVQVVGRKYQSSALQDHQRQEIVEKLTKVMTTDQLFLDSDLSLESLALQLNLPKHHITEVLNDYLHLNFYQFLNKYRVNEAQRLIKANGHNANLTAIGFDSGFKSKSTFNKYFKDTTGLSPSEYRSQFLQLLQ